MTFQNRVTGSQPFEDSIITDLRSWGFELSKNGSEHTHVNFINKLQRSEDATSIMVRYTPDLVVAFGEIPYSAYVEIKKSVCIEKNAYLNYMRLMNGGANIFVVIDTGECIKFSRVENIKLYTGNNKNGFPIDDDGWISPRLDQKILAVAIKNGFKGSGTPYKVISTGNLFDWNKINFFLEFDWCKNSERE
jgi:hypothetical protein